VSSTYPSTLDCNGEPVFGDLAGQKIRHHKLPSRALAPLTEEVNGELVSNNLALEFNNITYPNSDIVGHFFVRAARTDGNKTVLDNAVMFQLKSELPSATTPTNRYETDFNMSSYRN
jgi:hypothetical protein